MQPSRTAQFRNRANVGLLAMAFVVILGTSVISVRSTNKLDDSIQRVAHTIKVKEQIHALRYELGGTESIGLRYMVGGEDAHRAALEAHLAAVGVQIGKLQASTLDNPRQLGHVRGLLEDYATLRERVTGSIRIKREELLAGDDMAAIRRIRDNRGERMVERMRKRLLGMSRVEDGLLVTRARERDALVKQTNATLMIANGLALVAGLLGFLALRRAQREAENALRAELHAAQVRRANDEKSAFLASMSHEIRTPMNAIFGFAQLLGDHVREPLQREWVAAIRKSGQMLLSLINDVLDLSKIEAGKLQLNAQGTDVAELVGETITLFEPMAEAKGLRLTCEIDPAHLAPVVIDATRLRQILMNLLSNAVKYTERGEVRLAMTMSPAGGTPSRNLTLRVTDTGAGIDFDEHARIFEPFYQADSPDGKFRQGTGLGLSITKRLIDMMQGRIHVVSSPGKGAAFTVEIPDLEQASAVVARMDEDARADFDRLRPLKILVVDDVEWNLEVAKGYLRNSRHDIVTARDGAEGVAAAQRIRPDVVLMDLRMPRMNGYRAFEAIRGDARLEKTKVVAVTASSLTDEDNTQKSAFDGYIRKPYAPLELFSTLAMLFGTEDGPEDATPAPPDEAPPADAADPESLAGARAEWRALRGEPLQALRTRMRIREIGEFSKRMLELSEVLGDAALQAEARRLQLSVQRFDVNQVKVVLDELAAWPEEQDDAQ